MFPFISAVARAGRDRCATIAPCIRAAAMDIAMAARGSAFATQTGAAFYAIKVSDFFLDFNPMFNPSVGITASVNNTTENEISYLSDNLKL